MEPAPPDEGTVVDGGNGIIGTMFQHLLPRLHGLEIVPMLFDPDGRFPVHEANPLKAENLSLLRKRVLAEKADFGAGFDGDGDRCALVDEQGAIVPCDLVTALLATHFLEHEGPSSVVYDLRSSKVVPEHIKRLGGTPVETRVGHSYIKRTMKEHHASFAGELSGHYYFRDFFGADSGLYAFLLLGNLISAAPSLSGLILPLQKYFHTGEINFKVADPGAAMFPGLRSPARRPGERARRRHRALQGLVVQRARLEHRAGGAPESRGAPTAPPSAMPGCPRSRR